MQTLEQTECVQRPVAAAVAPTPIEFVDRMRQVIEDLRDSCRPGETRRDHEAARPR